MIPFAARQLPAGWMPHRRDWLRVGVPAGLAPMFAGHTSAARAVARAKSVLVVFTSGGQSQFETWDPKPNAPEEIRGAFGSIATSIPGTRVCEHLPRLARLINRVTLLRSMTHDDVDHGSACYLALTGQFHPRKSSNPLPQSTDYPALGAVLHRVRPIDRFPHSAFHVNGPLLVPTDKAPGQSGGFLGRGYDPLELGDVTTASQLLAGLEPPPDLPRHRLDTRRRLAARLDGGYGPASHPELVRKAYELIDSPQVRSAFDLDTEPARIRDRYGRYRAGQACLLGRRLVEAGVPWVTVFFNHTIRGQDDTPSITDEYGWDTHNDIFEAMRTHLLPRFDHSFSALLEDMETRGLLNETLVVCLGEFGRAPLVAREKSFAGTSPGRKHWARCYSVALAGAGIRRGALYGASDRQGAYPQDKPVTPGDLAATMFQTLGIDQETHYRDIAGRPQRMTTGHPVAGLFS